MIAMTEPFLGWVQEAQAFPPFSVEDRIILLLLSQTETNIKAVVFLNQGIWLPLLLQQFHTACP